MPYQEPGVLNERDYWDLTAYLLRENGIPLPGAPLGAGNASEIRLSSSGATLSAEPPTPTNLPEATPATNANAGATTSANSGQPVLIWGLVILGLALAGLLLVRAGRGPSSQSSKTTGGPGDTSNDA